MLVPATEDVSAASSAAPGSLEEAARAREVREVKLTNLDKVFWPAAAAARAYTKGDLVAYYDRVAPLLLPYMRDRPLVLTRYPDGIAGKSFFQKDTPDFVPDWVRTVRIRSTTPPRGIDYVVADDVETVRYLANLGTIPIHLWASRAGCEAAR